MKNFLIVVCFLATVLDGIAVALGLCVAAKIRTIPGYLFATIGALLIIALLVCSREILQRQPQKKQQDAIFKRMFVFWVMSLCVNVFAVSLACFNHIILGNSLTGSANPDWKQAWTADWIQMATVLVLIIFLSASPSALSFLWNKFYEEEDDEIPEPAQEKKIPT